MNLKDVNLKVEHPYTAMYHPIWALNTLKHKVSYTKIYEFHHLGKSLCGNSNNPLRHHPC